MIKAGEGKDQAMSGVDKVFSRSVPRILPRGVNLVGYWSAILTSLFSSGWVAAFIFGTVLYPPGEWTGIEGFVASFEPIQMLNFIPSLPLASAFLALMVCVYLYAEEEKKVWGLLGLVFSIFIR
jgi:hypothetical protein